MTGAWVLFVLAITTNGHGVAATTARFNTEAACQKALDWRKTRAAHDLGDGRFAIVLTNDFVIEAVPATPAVEPATEPAPKKKGKAD